MQLIKRLRPVSLVLLAVLFMAVVAGVAVASQIQATKEASPSPMGVNKFYPGQTIYYTMTVTNPVGNHGVTNTLTAIWDTLPNGTVIQFLAPGETLVQGPGDTKTFTASYVVNPADVVYIQALNDYGVRNKFEALGYDSAGDDVYALVTRNSKVLEFAELGDRLWNDLDRDGIQDAGEPGIGGVGVTLFDCVTDEVVASTTTDGNGNYLFGKLMEGEYRVVFDKPAGDWAFTLQDQGADDAKDSDVNAAGETGCYTLAAGDKNYTADGGVYQLKEDLLVSKTAVTSFTRTHLWDIDKYVKTDDGKTIEYEGEIVPKIWLYVDGSGDESGYWYVDVTYEGYKDSDFKVCGEVKIENTGDLPATINTVDDVIAGTASADVDFGVTLPYELGVGKTITGTYCEAVEGKVEGVNEVSVETDRDYYSDTADITWGDPETEVDKTVTIEDESDLFGTVELGTVTAPNDGHFDYAKAFAWKDYSDPGPHIYRNTATILETEQSASALLDVNWVPPAAIGDYVWKDVNQNGIQDAGEAGIPGATVKLFKCDGTLVATTVTNGSGYYKFDMLMEGNYYVEFVLPTGYVFSPMDQGGDDALDSDADMTTGKTACTLLEAGETDLTWDVGMYMPRQMKSETAWARMYDKPMDFTYKFVGHPWFSYLITKPTAEKKTFYFYAARTYRVGEVDIWKEGNFLKVQIRMNDGFTLADSKVNVQLNLSRYPKVNWSPGQYPYTGGDTFTIPWNSAWTGKDLYIAVHGNVLSYWD